VSIRLTKLLAAHISVFLVLLLIGFLLRRQAPNLIRFFFGGGFFLIGMSFVYFYKKERRT
jgi:hypothetical protein